MQRRCGGRSLQRHTHPWLCWSGLLVVFVKGPGSARSDLKMEHVDPGRLRISAARRQGDVHPARGWVRHRRQGRALGHSVDQAWCAAPAARMGPPLTESPGRCRVDERGSCGEPHGGHHAARCASCARAQGLAGTVRGIKCRHGVLLGRCACRSAQPSSRGWGWQGPGRSLLWWMTRHARGVDPSGGRGRSRHPFGTGTSVEGTRQVTTATPAMLVFFERTERARSPREPTVETATRATVKAACAAPAARPLIGRPLGQAVDGVRFGGRAHLAWQRPGSPATARG